MDEQLLEMIARGTVLARIDDVDYVAVRLVFAWPRAGVITPYCLEVDWPQTLPARLADRDQRLAELEAALQSAAELALTQVQRAEKAEAKVAELERLIVEAPVIPPAVAAAATGMPRQYRPPSDGGRGKRIECAICHAQIWPKLFDAHMAKHTRIDAPNPEVTEPPAAPRVQLVDDNPAWRCAESGCSGAFTRSLTNPSYCAKHAPITNGHLAAA